MKTIVISLLVAALSIATPASPARADSQEAAGLLAGIVAIGLMARAINERNAADRAEAEAEAGVLPDAVTRNDAWRPYRVNPRAAQAQLLPETCLIDGHRGLDTALYDRRCLERTAARPGDLPDYCELKIRTDRGWRAAYGESCLMREGFRPEYRWARR
jgi:hypothetical protein